MFTTDLVPRVETELEFMSWRGNHKYSWGKLEWLNLCNYRISKNINVVDLRASFDCFSRFSNIFSFIQIFGFHSSVTNTSLKINWIWNKSRVIRFSRQMLFYSNVRWNFGIMSWTLDINILGALKFNLRLARNMPRAVFQINHRSKVRGRACCRRELKIKA